MTRMALRLSILSLALLLAGCFHRQSTRPGTSRERAPPVESESGRYAQALDSGPGGPPPDIDKIPEPVPKVEPRSRYGNKSPYTVLGKTYSVLPNCAGYDERGIASWYGKKFHGYTTSNFEHYDMYAYTAASKVLPLPCYVRVTNLENGRSVIVRVNDRGPFVANRIIDLSYVAAVKLGVYPKGTALVEVRGLDPNDAQAHTERPAHGAVTMAPEKTHKPQLYLQVGAYADLANARRAADRLQAANVGRVVVVSVRVNGKMLHRVRLGPLRDPAEADRLSERLRTMGLGTAHVAVDN